MHLTTHALYRHRCSGCLPVVYRFLGTPDTEHAEHEAFLRVHARVRTRGSHSTRPCLRGRNDRSTSARVIFCRRSDSHGVSQLCRHTDCLMQNRVMVSGSDVSPVRRFYILPAPPFVLRTTWPGSPRPLRLYPSAEAETTSTPRSDRQLDRPDTLYPGALTDRNHRPGCDFRHGHDPLPLSIRGASDVMCSAGRLTCLADSDGSCPKGLCTPEDVRLCP